MHYHLMIVGAAEADVFCLLYNFSVEYSFGSRIVFLGELNI